MKEKKDREASGMDEKEKQEKTRKKQIAKAYGKYTKSTDIFSDSFQFRIEKYYTLFSDYGSYCMLSNSDPHNVDSTDDFFDNLYKGCNIKRVNIKRLLSCKATSRSNITELLITNYE